MTYSKSKNNRTGSRVRTGTTVQVYHVDAYLKSEETKRMYIWHFNRFMKYFNIKQDAELLRLDTKRFESMIIEYLFDHLTKEEGLKKRTVQMAMSAIFRFCMMNDLMINKSKISTQIQPDENHTEDRSYTREEIAELLRQSTDERFRAVILLMANSLRVGAIPTLQIQDLIPKSVGPGGEILDNDSGIEKLYMIWVYSRSASNKYYMFCTPECRIAIDKYLQFRKDQGEEPDKTNAQLPLLEQFKKTSPLIRTQFDKGDNQNPKPLTDKSIKKGIERTISRARLNTLGSVAMTHGLRKFAITQMIKAKVDYEVREYVSGHRHSRGLDTSYDRLNPNERLEMWQPAINFLTINGELRLEKKLKVVTEGQAQEIAELKAQLLAIQKELFIRTGRQVVFGKDTPIPPIPVPVAEGKMTEITKEEWLKDSQKWIDKQQQQQQLPKPNKGKKRK
jgi:site-specific recombinase XerC